MSDRPGLDPEGRRAQIATGLAAVERRITAACDAARRPREAVTLVAVTKTVPAGDVRHLAALGVCDVGENKVQELAAKAEGGAYVGLRVHLIGRLQSNKALLAATLADVVHSLDRAKLIAPLARGAEQAGRSLTVLLQVSLDGDPARGGVPAESVRDLACAVLDSSLLLGGVMAVAPLGLDPAAAFARLRTLSESVLELAPQAGMISAGMSADLEAAIANGATHLRVGSAILGSRPPLG